MTGSRTTPYRPTVPRARGQTSGRGAGDAVGRWWGPVAATLVTVAWLVSPVIGFRGSLLVLTVMGFASLVIAFRSPAYGLLGITILCVIDAPARVYLLTGGLLRWNTFNYCLLGIMVLYLPSLVRLRDRHSLYLMLFILLLVVDLVISRGIPDGIQHILGISITFGLLVYFVRAGVDRRMWFWVGTVGGLIGALGGLAWFLQRAHLPPINENAWAEFPATAMFAICFAFPSATSLRRGQQTLMALATVNLVWIFLSGSRGNLLIGVCSMILLVLTMRNMRQRTTAILVALLLGAGAAAQFSGMQERALFRVVKLFTTSEQLAGNYSLSSRTSGRSDLAMGGWYIFKNHPFGIGTGGFAHAWEDLNPAAFRNFTYMGNYGRGELRQAHSGWVKTLAENGIPGMVLLIAYVMSFAAAALRTRNRTLRRIGLLTSITLCAALLSTEFQGKALWYLAAGATTVLERRSLFAAFYGSSIRLGRRRRPPADTQVPIEHAT